LARRLDLERHVTFHGPLRTAQLIPLYQAAHALVVTSHHEAAAVVALEAALTGVPVVGTAVGYLNEWAPDAAVVSRADAASLATTIIDLLRDPARRASIAASARAWALAHDADWTASEFERIYASLAERRAGRSHAARRPTTPGS
jgi:glycosyltransferase involved in cell wall biosynthesis